MKSLILLASLALIPSAFADFDPQKMVGRWFVEECVDQAGRSVESKEIGVSEEMAKQGLEAQMLVADGKPEFFVSGLTVFKDGNDMLLPSFRMGYSYKDTVCNRELGQCTGGRTFKIWDRLEESGVSKKIHSCGRWSCGNFFMKVTVNLEGEKLRIGREYYEDIYSCTFRRDSQVEILP